MYSPFALATAGAVGVGVIALADAVTFGITGAGSVFSAEYGLTGWYLVGSLVHALMYAAIAWLLHDNAARIDHGNLTRTVLRRLLIGGAVIYAALYGLLDPVLRALGGLEPAWLDALDLPSTLLFLLMFLVAFVLGIMLRKEPGMRPASLLLMSIGPVILATVLIAAAGEPLADFAHPAYAEIVTNLGLALTGLSTARDGGPRLIAPTGPLGPAGAALPRS